MKFLIISAFMVSSAFATKIPEVKCKLSELTLTTYNKTVRSACGPASDCIKEVSFMKIESAEENGDLEVLKVTSLKKPSNDFNLMALTFEMPQVEIDQTVQFLAVASESMEIGVLGIYFALDAKGKVVSSFGITESGLQERCQ